jgi:serine/threonine-protein kinase RsbW
MLRVLVISFTLQVESTLESLTQVLDWFESLKPLLPSHVSERNSLECELILAEGFTNAVRHAHRLLPSHTPIEIQLVMTSSRLEIRIWDQGPPFNLEDYLARHPIIPTLTEGGRGLHIMKAVTRSLQYLRFEDQRNCLIAQKEFSNLSHLQSRLL